MIDPSLKILFCAFQVVPDPSGASTRLATFLRALNGACTVDALTAKSPDVAHIERFHGARLMRVPLGVGDLAARSQAFERAVSRQLESNEYQIIQFSDPFAGAALLDHKSKLRFKAVYDATAFPSFDLRYTDPHLEGDRTFMAKVKRAELLCLMGADAVLTSTAVHRESIAALGVPRAKISVIPPAVALETFEKFSGARPDRIPMRLIYLGSQVAWQGLSTLLFAMKEALKHPAASGLRLSIVGPRHPDWRSQLDEQVKALGLAGNVEFLDPPPKEDLPRLIAQHDVGVAPLEKSDRNREMGGVTMKLAEYAAAGRAIICSDMPLTRALLDEQVAVFFAPSREPALAQVIVALAKDPLRRVQMGQAARALAAERFDAERAGAQLLDIYAGFGLSGVGAVSGELEEAPTSVGVGGEAEGERMPEPDTGRVRVADADTGKVAAPAPRPEPTPVVPGIAHEPTPVIAGALIDEWDAPDEPAQPLAGPSVLALFGEDAAVTGELAMHLGPPDVAPSPARPLTPTPAGLPRHARPATPTLHPPVLFRAVVAPTTGGHIPTASLGTPDPTHRPVPSPPSAAVGVASTVTGELAGAGDAPSADPAISTQPALSAAPFAPLIAPVGHAPAPASSPVLELSPLAVSPPSEPPRLPTVAPPVLASPPRPPSAAIPAAPPRPPSAAIPAAPPRPPSAAVPATPPRPPSAAIPAAPPRPPSTPAALAPPPRPPSAASIPAAPPRLPTAGAPVHVSSARPASVGGELMELGDDDVESLDGEPEFLEADDVEAVEPLPPAILQNSVDLGGPNVWFLSLMLGFAPLGQLGAAPVRGSPLAAPAPTKS